MVARRSTSRHVGPCAAEVTAFAQEAPVATPLTAVPTKRRSAGQALRRQDTDVVPADDPGDRALRRLRPAVQGLPYGPVDQGIPTSAVQVNRSYAAVEGARPDLAGGTKAGPSTVAPAVARHGLQAPEVGAPVTGSVPSYPVLHVVARASNPSTSTSMTFHEARQTAVPRSRVGATRRP